MVRSLLLRWVKDARGAAAAETAIIFTFLVIPVLLGIFELTNLRRSTETLQEATYRALLPLAGSVDGLSAEQLALALETHLSNDAQVTISYMCVHKSKLVDGASPNGAGVADDCDGANLPADVLAWKHILVQRPYEPVISAAIARASHVTASQFLRVQ